MIRFFVPGQPKGKMRPRAAHFGGVTRMYDDKAQVTAENWVKVCAEKAGVTNHGGDILLAGRITVFVDPPKTVTRKLAAAMCTGQVRPTRKPDLDNVEKLIYDALNKLAYNDDSQIVDMRASRRYTTDVTHPAHTLGEGVLVEIREWVPPNVDILPAPETPTLL